MKYIFAMFKFSKIFEFCKQESTIYFKRYVSIKFVFSTTLEGLDLLMYYCCQCTIVVLEHVTVQDLLCWWCDILCRHKDWKYSIHLYKNQWHWRLFFLPCLSFYLLNPSHLLRFHIQFISWTVLFILRHK